MPLTLTWEQIALRILLATVASMLIGLNRDERGHPAGMRTTMPENFMPRVEQTNLCLALDANCPEEAELRKLNSKAGCEFTRWETTYSPPGGLTALECTIRWRERASRQAQTPLAIAELRSLQGVRSLTWRE